MKQWPSFHRPETNKEIHQPSYDWLAELVAIALAALIVATFVFVGDFWIRSQIGH
jgi:hypothetical protein